MNARELHDDLKPHGTASWTIIGEDDRSTILRALALLAAVEESDGLVRELSKGVKTDLQSGEPLRSADQIMQQAAARIVALEAELASVKAQRDQAWKAIEAGVHLDDAVRRATAANPRTP